MIAALAAIVIGLPAQTLELTPTDDVWVYPHASNPQDELLRVWGNASQSVATDPNGAEEFGYSYVKFDLAKLPKDSKVTAATLLLTHSPDPAWTAPDAKSSPLEVRPLIGTFVEKTWDYGMAKTVSPLGGKDGILGKFAPEKVESGKPVKFEIDLTKGTAKLEKYLLAGGPFNIALTSTLDPSEIGNRATYKFYSKDYEKTEYRPKLVISYE
jgi:hypothetical protein